MIQSVGIDLRQARHTVCCLDGTGQPCDSFSFQTTPEGLAHLEQRIFRDGADPVIALEPAGLPWLMVAVYLRSRRPDCRLVRTRTQKAVAPPRYLLGLVESNCLDALTLARMPLNDPQQLFDIYMPPAEINALQLLILERQRFEDSANDAGKSNIFAGERVAPMVAIPT